MSMIDTAENVAKRYGISREAQDEYGLQSQQRTAAAQEAGRYDAEIAPMTTTMAKQDRETGEITQHEVTVSKDECNRPTTTLDGLAGLQDGSRSVSSVASLPPGASRMRWALGRYSPSRACWSVTV
mgnify:CR=1 FL=1